MYLLFLIVNKNVYFLYWFILYYLSDCYISLGTTPKLAIGGARSSA